MPGARRHRCRRIEWERVRWGKLHFIFNVQSKVLPQVAFIFGASNVMSMRRHWSQTLNSTQPNQLFKTLVEEKWKETAQT